jgi:DNA-binding transcriptional MerR regulator
MPSKLFFRIGEVAALVGVRPHVLRYWEQELGLLRPMKTRGAHRQYRRRDVEIARLVRQLTEVEGYTAAGAKKKIAELRGGKKAGPTLSRELTSLRDELIALSASLAPAPPRRLSIEPAGETAPAARPDAGRPSAARPGAVRGAP